MLLQVLLLNSRKILFQQLGDAGQRGDGALQNAVHIGDGDAVISHRDILLSSTFVAVQHLAFVQHAGAAMDDESVRRQVGGKFRAAAPGKFRLRPGVAAYPGGQLNGADVGALAVVGAAFADENFVAVFDFI